MQDALRHTVLERLVDDAKLDPRVGTLIDAACEGDEALDRALAGVATTTPPPRPDAVPARPPGAWLRRIDVRGFRGIGEAATLVLDPGPGLTLVVGRNGSGKSSFAEALEVVLTGATRRWQERKGVEWTSAWRNLHVGGEARVAATFAVEGSTLPITLARRWPEGTATLGDAVPQVRRGNDVLDDPDPMRWADALATHRPMLSYHDLGALVDGGPSHLYDELKGILGLEDLTVARERLARHRKLREGAVKDSAAALAPLRAHLDGVTDPRAATCLAAIDADDLAAVERVVLGQGAPDPALDDLRRAASLAAPTSDAVLAAVTALRAAHEGLASVEQGRDVAALSVAHLLEQALDHHERHGDGPCPVCRRGTLDAAWAHASRERLDALLDGTTRLVAARRAREDAVNRAHRLLQPPPPVLARAAGLGLPDARPPWDEWASAATVADPLALAAHLETAWAGLDHAVRTLAQAARAEVARREDAWLPVAAKVAAWLPIGRAAHDAATDVPALKKAEKWLTSFEADLREERFQPIADRAREVWALLRQDSAVDLARIGLAGSSTRRRVDLDVTVDGSEAVALGVMSQGELNSLALALFVPRLTQPDSPFRFLVVDDPVQSMDPHKVDGLARVLEGAARDRQVVVFTHDTRLAEAVRRMRIPARIVHVHRRGASAVEVTEYSDPAWQHLGDARQVALSSDVMGPGVVARVVPTFCRAAVEAALVGVIRARRLGRGDPHLEVEEAIARSHTVMELAGLALFDDERAGGKVFERLNSRWGPRSADTLRAVKEGAHGGFAGNAIALVDDTRDLVKHFAELA